jgi:hypothetical protein
MGFYKNVKLPFPIHPFLFAIFPILFFYSNNIEEVFLDVLPTPIAFSFAITFLLLSILSFLFKNVLKTSLFVSLFLILFFSYGHVKNAVGALDLPILVVWVLVFIGGVYSLVRIKGDLTRLVYFLNIVSILLVAISLANIIYFEVSTGRSSRLFGGNSNGVTTNVEKINKPENPPDIYYLIFDRYASFETIENTYNHNLNEFKHYLTNKGFYIAEKSRSNYPRTFLSLGSSLNMGYVNFLSDELGADSSDEAAAYYLLEDYKVQKILKSIGYKYVHIGGWWEPTRRNKNADENFSYSPFKFKLLEDLDEFSTKLIETTMLSVFLTRASSEGATEPLWGRTNHRKGILYQFEKLEEASGFKGPKFVFAHFLIPHPPYVLDQNCQTLTESQTKSKPNKENYLNQLTCANKKIKAVVGKIFTASKGSAVIILQSDEGSDSIHSSLNKKWQDSKVEAIKEKTGILNAYHLPGKENEAKKILHGSITPVNSFRVVFNLYFGTNAKLLDDKVYMIENKQRPYKFFDFTDRLR